MHSDRPAYDLRDERCDRDRCKSSSPVDSAASTKVPPASQCFSLVNLAPQAPFSPLRQTYISSSTQAPLPFPIPQRPRPSHSLVPIQTLHTAFPRDLQASSSKHPLASPVQNQHDINISVGGNARLNNTIVYFSPCALYDASPTMGQVKAASQDTRFPHAVLLKPLKNQT